jgi:RNA polymerase sigma factor (sigma-70 family)
VERTTVRDNVEPSGCPAGDEFSCVTCTKHGAAVLAYAERLTRDRGAAEDVLQETMLRAWRHPGVLVNGKDSVREWLMTVAQRIVIDRARAMSARPAELGMDHDMDQLVALVMGLSEASDRSAAKAHLAECPACRQELRELQEIDAAIRRVPPEAFLEGPPADADLVLHRVLREVRTRDGPQEQERGEQRNRS